MNKKTIRRIQDLAGIKKKVLKEAYETWEPKNETLAELVDKHNSVYNYLERNFDDIEYDDRKFKRAWNLARDFYNSVKIIWKKFIPVNAPEMNMELWGLHQEIDPNDKAEEVLRRSKHALDRALQDMDIVYLDNAYSYAHGVLKIIKQLQKA